MDVCLAHRMDKDKVDAVCRSISDDVVVAANFNSNGQVVISGTVSGIDAVIPMLKEAGASEVHVRIASPQIKAPCFYGVDISTYDELLCAHKSLDQVKEYLAADSIGFLSEEALFEAGQRNDYCLACFSGRYPTALFQSIEDANKDGKF